MSIGSGQTVRMRRQVWAFAGRTYMYHIFGTLMSRLNYFIDVQVKLIILALITTQTLIADSHFPLLPDFEIDMSRVPINQCAIWIKDYIWANISHGELGTENNIGIGLDLPTKCADNRQRTQYKAQIVCEKRTKDYHLS